MGAHQQSERKISSVVVHEEFTTPVPQPEVRYVEIPQYEEVVTHVTKKEVREVEKRVPKIIEEFVERIVEVPQYEEVIRHVEVPQVREVIKEIPRIEVQERYYDVVKHVPKVEIKHVEKVVEVPFEVISVPKEVTLEERIPVARYQDTEQMLIVAQTIRPIISEGGQEVHVDVIEYEPEIVPVDIHVAKFVDLNIVNMGIKETFHRVVTVPSAQYNSMLRYLNTHLSEEERQNLPFLQENGKIKFLSQEFQWCAPPSDVRIEGYKPGVIHSSGIAQRVEARSGASALQIEADQNHQQQMAHFEQMKVNIMNKLNEFNRNQEITVSNKMRSAGASFSGSHTISANVGGIGGSISVSGAGKSYNVGSTYGAHYGGGLSHRTTGNTIQQSTVHGHSMQHSGRSSHQTFVR